ncbi:MAG: hypothetical protein ABI380_11235 [Edaphobacter sp.]
MTNKIAVLGIAATLLGAVIQGIGIATAPLVQAAIEAYKEKMPA